MRNFIDAILQVIGAASLTNDEFATITVEEQAYTVELYREILAVLDARELVSNARDRLMHYFLARGVELVTVTTPEAESKVYFGADLGEVL